MASCPLPSRFALSKLSYIYASDATRRRKQRQEFYKSHNLHDSQSVDSSVDRPVCECVGPQFARVVCRKAVAHQTLQISFGKWRYSNKTAHFGNRLLPPDKGGPGGCAYSVSDNGRGSPPGRTSRHAVVFFLLAAFFLFVLFLIRFWLDINPIQKKMSVKPKNIIREALMEAVAGLENLTTKEKLNG
jgi:hypothetical protein